MQKSPFATPVEQILGQNQHLRHLCIGFCSNVAHFHKQKSPFATPVERFLVQNQHVRCLCIGFWSKKHIFSEKVTVCDACRALLGLHVHEKGLKTSPLNELSL